MEPPPSVPPVPFGGAALLVEDGPSPTLPLPVEDCDCDAGMVEVLFIDDGAEEGEEEEEEAVVGVAEEAGPPSGVVT